MLDVALARPRLCHFLSLSQFPFVPLSFLSVYLVLSYQSWNGEQTKLRRVGVGVSGITKLDYECQALTVEAGHGCVKAIPGSWFHRTPACFWERQSTPTSMQ